MKKILFVLATLLLCLTPAFAQRNNQHQQRQSRIDNRQFDNRQFHDNRHMDRREPAQHRDNVRTNHQEYRGRFEARDRWDGRRFDRGYFGNHYGRDHRFYWEHCRWYGPRFYPGSRFWYGGAWFVIVDTIPDYWGDEEVYIDEIDGVYYLVNPTYPGARFVVTVVF